MKRKRSSNTHKLNSNFFICLYISTCIIQEIKTIFVINEKINTRKTTNSIREKWEKNQFILTYLNISLRMSHFQFSVRAGTYFPRAAPSKIPRMNKQYLLELMS